MTIHNCKFCNYSINKKNDFDKHLLTKKHQKNIKEKDKQNEHDNNENSNIMMTLVDNQQQLVKQNEEVIKQNEELRKEIEKLKEVNNQNTNKIVKEARSIKKSILTILNTNFRDTPSIDYIDENRFKKELEQLTIF